MDHLAIGHVIVFQRLGSTVILGDGTVEVLADPSNDGVRLLFGGLVHQGILGIGELVPTRLRRLGRLGRRQRNELYLLHRRGFGRHRGRALGGRRRGAVAPIASRDFSKGLR